uniref:Uncharacterized protein n=1 Tax=viral metagenome TaxID=1070528 RepID=A0A6C0HM51_9ZZZZ
MAIYKENNEQYKQTSYIFYHCISVDIFKYNFFHKKTKQQNNKTTKQQNNKTTYIVKKTI